MTYTFYMRYPSQYGGVSGNTLLDTVKTVRDAIAYTGLTHAPLWTLSFHFTAVFDMISHT